MENKTKGGVENLGRKIAQTLLFAFITIFLLVLLINKGGGINKFFSIINSKFLVLILLTLLLVWIFNAFKLMLVIKILEEEISLPLSFEIVLAAIFGANITPFYSGGMAAQIYFLSKSTKNIGKSSAVSVIYLILSLIISMFFSIIFLLTPHPHIQGTREYFFISLIIFVLTLSVTSFIFIRYPAKISTFFEKVYKKFTKKEPNRVKLESVIYEFSEGMGHFLQSKNRKLIIIAILVSLISQGLYFLMTPLAFYLLNIPINLKDVLLTQIAFNFTASIGFSPGGIGVIEGAFAGFFYPFAPTNIALLTLIYRIFSFYIPTIIGGFFFFFLIRKHY